MTSLYRHTDRKKAEVLEDLINYQDKLRELIYRKYQEPSPQLIKDTFDNVAYIIILIVKIKIRIFRIKEVLGKSQSIFGTLNNYLEKIYLYFLLNSTNLNNLKY